MKERLLYVLVNENSTRKKRIKRVIRSETKENVFFTIFTKTSISYLHNIGLLELSILKMELE